MEAGDIFDLASITKVTGGALAMMKLYDNGLIELDAGIKNYVTGFNGNKRGEATVRETLAHQAGWRPWIPYYQSMRKKNGEWKRKFFRTERSDDFPIKITDSLYLTKNNYRYIKSQIKKSNFEPGKGYSYSGLFSYLIPELVENLTDTSFVDYLNANFYQILGAETLGYNPLDRFSDTLIVPTEIDTFFRIVPIHGTVHDEGAIVMGGVSANAGLFSNASDLAKVWSMFLNDGFYDTLSLLKPQTLDLFTAVQFPNNDNRRGLGFDKPLLDYDEEKSGVGKSASFRSYGHSGYTGPLVWADPDADLLFIFLCNRVYPTRQQRMIYELGIRPRLHELTYQLIKE
jgi:CubicO group peptidase (beta-lactamase class C family)